MSALPAAENEAWPFRADGYHGPHRTSPESLLTFTRALVSAFPPGQRSLVAPYLRGALLDGNDTPEAVLLCARSWAARRLQSLRRWRVSTRGEKAALRRLIGMADATAREAGRATAA